jgi:predicted RNA-binding Zn-ribbon protein involved in translation (DUF1610 family)
MKNRNEYNFARCPSCNYDLTGLIPDKKIHINCPECNKETTYALATNRASRWQTIRIAFLIQAVIPLFISICSYGIYTQWEYDNETLFTLGFLPVVFSPPGILISFVVITITEWNDRHKLPKKHFFPNTWITGTGILLSAAIGFTATFTLIGIWAEAIASV